MTLFQRLKSLDVKRELLAANEAIGLFEDSNSLDSDNLVQGYGEILVKYVKMDEKNIDSRIRDKKLIALYNKYDWFMTEESLGELLLNRNFSWLGDNITKNVNEVAERINFIIKSKNTKNNKIPMEFMNKIYSIHKDISFVSTYFPLIVLPSEHLENSEGYFNYIIEDGNVRAIAYRLSGIEDSLVYLARNKL